MKKMHHHKPDKKDLQIMELLQREGRMKRNELAEKVELTIPSVSERMRKLEEHGYISGYVALLDARKANLDMMAFIFVTTDSSTHFRDVIEEANRYDEIVECHAITGSGSHLLKVRCRNTAHLEQLLAAIQSWDGVKNTMTNIVLSSPKETTAIPLEQLKEDENK